MGGEQTKYAGWNSSCPLQWHDKWAAGECAGRRRAPVPVVANERSPEYVVPPGCPGSVLALSINEGPVAVRPRHLQESLDNRTRRPDDVYVRVNLPMQPVQAQTFVEPLASTV